MRYIKMGKIDLKNSCLVKCDPAAAWNLDQTLLITIRDMLTLLAFNIHGYPQFIQEEYAKTLDESDPGKRATLLDEYDGEGEWQSRLLALASKFNDYLETAYLDDDFPSATPDNYEEVSNELKRREEENHKKIREAFMMLADYFPYLWD